MIGIIGAGASGMAAADHAARLGSAVAVLERGERAGRKLPATGNGRCNITNALPLLTGILPSSPKTLKKCRQTPRPKRSGSFSIPRACPPAKRKKAGLTPAALAGAVVDSAAFDGGAGVDLRLLRGRVCPARRAGVLRLLLFPNPCFWTG